jgi:hypothetical protein
MRFRIVLECGIRKITSSDRRALYHGANPANSMSRSITCLGRSVDDTILTPGSLRTKYTEPECMTDRK